MGCFTILKYKKNKSDQIMLTRHSGRRKNASLPSSPSPSSPPTPPLPSSFRARSEPIQPATDSNRARAMSAPSALEAAEQNALSAVEYEETEEPRFISMPLREHHASAAQPQPQPLPRPPSGAALRVASGTRRAYFPLPIPPTMALRYFRYQEIAAACHNCSEDWRMSEYLSPSSKKSEATITCLHPSTQGLKEFIIEVNTLASLQHPNICRLLGFYARNRSEPRMLVYERLCRGSLDSLLFNRFEEPTLNWNSRLKIAICAAEGLTFLHDKEPFQVMYNEFTTSNIQIGKDFSAKLSGYGCVRRIPEEASGNLSTETLQRGMLTPKSIVWSFGIVLLELLTGRKNLDSRHHSEERNLVRWCWHFMADDYRLSLIMDPRLKGRYPPRAAKALADIAQRCLQKEPSIRPNMKTIVKHLKMIHDSKYFNSFPLPEPMSRSPSPSYNDVVPCNPPLMNFLLPSLAVARLHVSPSGMQTLLPPPPSPSSSISSIEELVRQETK